jgi:hypothetical protein
VVFAAALGLCLLIQSASGAYRSDFSGFSDEPAHVVSSLMVRDYLAHGLLQNPLQFARNFYAHYPKVAIGHWPPLFHLSEAVWMLIFGRTKSAMLVWIAVVSAMAATLVFAWTRRECGLLAAVFATAILLASPLLQGSIPSVMLDIPMGLLSLAAALSLGEYYRSGERHHLLLYAGWCAAALATNGRGVIVALAWIPASAILSKPPRRKWFALLIATVLLMLLPNVMPGDEALSLSAVGRNFWRAFASTAEGMSWPVLLLAIAGATAAYRAREEMPQWAGILGFAASMWLFESLLMWPFEERYLLMWAPAVASLAALGLGACTARLPAAGAIAAVVACLLAVFAMDYPRYNKKPDLGYHALVGSGLVAPHHVSLVAGDGFHEGSFIAEMALRYPGDDYTVRRASKVLASSTWAGYHYKLLFLTPEAVAASLDASDVTLIVVQDRFRPHVGQLNQALDQDSGHWKLDPAAFPRYARVFERVHD